MSNLTINLIERYILEVIGNKSRSIQEITHDSKLDYDQVSNTLNNLLTKKIIDQNNTLFQINQDLTKEDIKSLQRKENKFFEFSEVVSTCLREVTHKKETELSFKLKKVLLDTKEEKILNGLLYNLEAFINSIPEKKTNISNQKILFWGGGKYENITSSTLNY